MDLMSLKYFQFVAMYRNFSRAAEHFYIGQSALSRQIAGLEKELGVQLFVRDTRNVRLTDAGAVLYEHCDLLLRHHELVFELMRAASSGNAGQLGICTVANFGAAFTDLIEKYLTTYPDVSTRIDDIPFQELSDCILHGVYDLAFTLDFEVPHNDALERVVIGHDRFVVAMRPDDPLVDQGPLDAETLLGQTLIMPRHVDPPILRQLRPSARGAHRTTPGLESVTNAESALLRVQLGLGVSLLPKHILDTAFHDGRIQYCEVSGLDTSIDLVAIYRSDNQQQTLRNFLALIAG